jgi:RNA polymerase sigma factor (sigma-70 family)
MECKRMIPIDPHEVLLAQLSTGDAEATRQVFLTYEPYLRLVVRRQLTPALRVRFDSVDIVQSVWADLVTGFQAGRWQFASPQQLRAFLVKVTRNRLIDRMRQQQTSLRNEQCWDHSELRELTARSTAVGAQLEADEIWQRLLTLCPAQHRGVLELKRQGLPLAEIAGRTGLHEGSVRRILYDLAAQLSSKFECPARNPKRPQQHQAQ